MTILKSTTHANAVQTGQFVQLVLLLQMAAPIQHGALILMTAGCQLKVFITTATGIVKLVPQSERAHQEFCGRMVRAGNALVAQYCTEFNTRDGVRPPNVQGLLSRDGNLIVAAGNQGAMQMQQAPVVLAQQLFHQPAQQQLVQQHQIVQQQPVQQQPPQQHQLQQAQQHLPLPMQQQHVPPILPQQPAQPLQPQQQQQHGGMNLLQPAQQPLPQQQQQQPAVAMLPGQGQQVQAAQQNVDILGLIDQQIVGVQNAVVPAEPMAQTGVMEDLTAMLEQLCIGLENIQQDTEVLKQEQQMVNQKLGAIWDRLHGNHPMGN